MNNGKSVCISNLFVICIQTGAAQTEEITPFGAIEASFYTATENSSINTLDMTPWQSSSPLPAVTPINKKEVDTLRAKEGTQMAQISVSEKRYSIVKERATKKIYYTYSFNLAVKGLLTPEETGMHQSV